MVDLEPEHPELLVGESPPWSRTTKTIVVVITLLLIALITRRFHGLIGQIVTAAVLAYVLNPLIKFIDESTPLKRSTLIIIVYFALILLVIGAFTALGVVTYGQVNDLIQELQQVGNLVDVVRDVVERLLEHPLLAEGPLEPAVERLNWESIQRQLSAVIGPVLSRSGQYASQFAGATLRILGNFLFIWIISIYLAIEIPRLGEYVGRAAQQPGYRRDAERLMGEFGQIWSAYLRGQIILGLVIGVLVGISLALLGVQNALALGILSGLLEFVPVVGPLVGTGAAVIMALFQSSNYLGLSSFEFALAVLAVMFVIQQLENNILVPRIVGEALDLHPLLVIIGVFMGASVAGILGAILAAPVIATIKLLGLYAWRKMFDLPPFPPTIETTEQERFSFVGRIRQLWRRTQIEEESPEPK